MAAGDKEENLEKDNSGLGEKKEGEDKLSKFKALIEAKKYGTNTPMPRKGKGMGSLDSTTSFGSKSLKKHQKSGGHKAK